MSVLKGEGTHTILYGPVDIYTGLHHTRGYLARPDEGGSHGTVLMLHGEGGISSAMKDLARRLARHGLAVVAPDLYLGEKPRLAGRQGRKEVQSNWPAADRRMTVVRDTYQFIASDDTPWVRAGALAVVAFGRAADVAVRFAAKEEIVSGLVLVSPVATGGYPTLRTPVLGLLGKDDPDAETQRGLREALDHGEWVQYGGVGSGILDDSAADYQWRVAEDAFERVHAFLTAALR